MKRAAVIGWMFLISCAKQMPKTCDSNQPLYESSAFPVGTAVDMHKFGENAVYKEVLTRNFNSVTAENAFKAEYIHPGADRYDWVLTDSLAGYCEWHGKRLHGHTLIWDQQLPEWISNFSGDRNDWIALMKEHIQTIVSYYRDRVHSWDVVNEAFNDDGSLKETIWYRNVGADYISKAFRFASEADPSAKLFYNDFQMELSPAKRNAVLQLLDAMRADGIQVDGVGLQMHVNIDYFEKDQLAKAIEDVAQHGYLVHISELDIAVNPFGDKQSASTDDLKRQADLLAFIVKTYRSIPSRQQFGITFWGISDADSWIPAYFGRKDFPLLFDAEYNPKPAYCALKKCL